MERKGKIRDAHKMIYYGTSSEKTAVAVMVIHQHNHKKITNVIRLWDWLISIKID